jgi:uncharacterized protein with HEPN domain
MPRSAVEFLEDTLTYSENCQQYLTGKTYLAYSNDDRLRRAIERCLSIVGEALSQAIKLDPEIVLAIPNTVRIIGLRHRLIHAYYEISDKMIWSIAQEQLHGFQADVRNLLADRSATNEED